MADEDLQAPARAFWSGTITFGLVSIPVDLFAAVQARATAMKMVDAKGHALGRQYYCSEDGKPLANDEIVRGYETKSGKVVVVTDAELEALAPEKTRDIELQRFVPRDRIAPAFYDRPYFLLPSGRSTKAYHLLAETMERAARAGIATFVMRDREYLVAIVSDRGVLRAETLRFASELRAPEDVGLPPAAKPERTLVKRYAAAISRLARAELDAQVLSDWYAEAIRRLVERKKDRDEDVIATPSGAEEDEEASGGAEIVDLMKMIKERLAKSATVTRALEGASSGKRSDTGERTDTGKRSDTGERSGTSERTDTGERTDARERSAERPSKDALYERARQLGIPGRSRMGKKQLQEAIRKAA